VRKCATERGRCLGKSDIILYCKLEKGLCLENGKMDAWGSKMTWQVAMPPRRLPEREEEMELWAYYPFKRQH